MIIINDDDDYSNPYEESDYNITKIKEWITKIRKVLPACMVLKIIIIEVIKSLVISLRIITV